MCIRERRPLPDKIKDAPSLNLGLEIYYLAYTELMSSRQIGFGEGAIPWHAIRSWAHDAELDEEQLGDLIYFVTVLDQAYLQAQSERREREQGNNGKPGRVQPKHP